MKDKIITLVCSEFGVSKEDVLSKDRRREYAYPRHMIAYLLRTHTSLGLKQIGAVLGRHHTTIIASLRTALDLKNTYPPFRDSLMKIIERL